MGWVDDVINCNGRQEEHKGAQEEVGRSGGKNECVTQWMWYNDSNECKRRESIKSADSNGIIVTGYQVNEVTHWQSGLLLNLVDHRLQPVAGRSGPGVRLSYGQFGIYRICGLLVRPHHSRLRWGLLSPHQHFMHVQR